MNNQGYLKFILTVLTLAVIASGYLMVSAVDRVRESNLRILERLDRLESAPLPRAAATAARPAEAAAPRAADVANAEFFDPEAVPGGRVVQTIMSDPPNLNPLISNEATASEFYGLCNATLADRNFARSGEFQPLLAESWEISPDHKTYRIRLRKGVFWQDFTDPVTKREHRNVEVTAHDFRFLWEVVMNPEVNCPALRSYYEGIEAFEIQNDYEFTIRWKEARYGSLTTTLAMTALPRHFYDYGGKFDGKAFNNDHLRNSMIVGNGAYKLVKWERGKQVVFRRDDRYFGRELGVGPAVEHRVYDLIQHPNTQFQALLSGDVDRLGLQPDQWRDRTDLPPFRDGKLKKYRYPASAYSYIAWNQARPLFADKRVRQALTLLIDRETIKRDIYLDLAEITRGPFAPTSDYSDPALKPWPHDPERAKALLKEAGWRPGADGILEKEGQKFIFSMMQIASHPIQRKMMPFIKEGLAAAGIDMKIESLEWSVFLQRIEQRHFDACSLAWTAPVDPDPYQVWHSSQAAAPESSNFINFRNPEADRLIEELRATFELPKRIELARRFERLLHEEQPYTFLFVPYALLAQSARYRNVRTFQTGVPAELFWVPRAEQLTVPGL